MLARLLTALFVLALANAAGAQDLPLRKLETGDQARGWDAVGRLDVGDTGFCTATLIAPAVVLTAAHCLYDKDTGGLVDPSVMEFRAGWRNGRAVAYRKVKRALVHPDYAFGGDKKFQRVAFDLAVLELDQPIRLSSVEPFETDLRPMKGDEVGVVSYAQDRSEAPSLQELCHVVERQVSVLVLSCSVDFGSSGAPIFAFRDGVARVVSVVSAKAEYEGQKVALGTALDVPLAALLNELQTVSSPFRKPPAKGAPATGSASSSAKFVKP
jgi:V8-like Glu-specific endopeptidase